jgi:arginine decarboxylase
LTVTLARFDRRNPTHFVLVARLQQKFPMLSHGSERGVAPPRTAREMKLVPTSVFLTSGVGVHRHRLTAFEFALRDADIEQQNLVTVSSILPPRCELIPRDVGVRELNPGEMTFCVLARAEADEAGRLIHASIGLARPADPAMYGYISEHHGFGMSSQASGDYAEDLAATMLASTLGVDFDPDAAWNERKKLYEYSNLIIDSMSITAATLGDAAGKWTCAIAAAVFRLPGNP